MLSPAFCVKWLFAANLDASTPGVVTGITIMVITIFGQPIILLEVTGMLVMTILSSRQFTILVLLVSRCQLIMRLQVLPRRV